MAEYNINKSYSVEFERIQGIIDGYKGRAYQTVNYYLVLTNWEIGKFISARLKSAEWGDKVVKQLADYLKEKDPILKGYDKRALYRMVQFYNTYSSEQFVGNSSPQIKEESALISFISQINWSSHLEIMSQCKEADEQLYYIKLCIHDHLKLDELKRVIESGNYEHSLMGETVQSPMMKQTYPNAITLFKDQYMVDYLNLPKTHSEKTLQQALVSNMKNFILELGKDFIFMGQEYRVQVGNDDFWIDLLFYHRELRCLVAIELKTTKFKPEYIGQLDFYLEALDRDVKKPFENPSIGILLCKSANQSVVEYALSRSLSPTMVSEYQRKLIPKDVLQRYLGEIKENK